MTQKEKELLLKDLCVRLPYELVINIGDKDLKLDRQHQGIGILYPEDCSDEFNERNNNSAFYITISGCYYGEEIKPYLRPMSSMTKEEKKIICSMNMLSDIELSDKLKYQKMYMQDYTIETFDLFNAHHFDYRGLIEKGLALEAPEEMYNIKEK